MAHSSRMIQKMSSNVISTSQSSSHNGINDSSSSMVHCGRLRSMMPIDTSQRHVRLQLSILSVSLSMWFMRALASLDGRAE